MILTPQDFKGFHNIAQDCYSESDLQCYIDKFEDLYLCMLLGDELMQLYIADLTADPRDPRFSVIEDRFCKVLSDCTCNEEKYISCGIKDMLACFIFYHYVIEQQYQNTMTGTVTLNNSQSHKVDNHALLGVAERRFNLGVDTYRAIQACLRDDDDLYPEFEGCGIDYKYHPFF